MRTLIIMVVLAISVLSTRATQKPNIIYILTDQWRASALSYAGDPNVQTPHIDQFAREAVNFTNAVTVAPVCTPYRAALLTGRYPTSTGMFLNDLYLPEKELCMAEIFKSEGYNTAYLGKWHLDGHGRLNNVSRERRQGFDYWKALECSHDYNNMFYYENKSEERRTWEEYSPNAIIKDARQYLAKHADEDKPFFMFLSIGTPHFPHGSAPDVYKKMYPENELELRPNVPKEWEQKVRKELNGYYGHCTATDQAIGTLLAEIKDLGIWENTIIVFTSDHGEMMGSQGVHPGAKQLAWDESIRVPFLIHYPEIGSNKGTLVNAPINTPDILPSLLTLADIEIPKTIEGEDLSLLIKSPDPDYDRAALIMNVCPFATEYKNKEYRAIRTKQYTYACSPEGAFMLFDNLKDPYQMDNLIGKEEYSVLQSELDKKLQNQLRKIGDENFQRREYYLDKWNLSINNKKTHAVDYQKFLVGEGQVQTPTLK